MEPEEYQFGRDGKCAPREVAADDAQMFKVWALGERLDEGLRHILVLLVGTADDQILKSGGRGNLVNSREHFGTVR